MCVRVCVFAGTEILSCVHKIHAKEVTCFSNMILSRSHTPADSEDVDVWTHARCICLCR